MNNFSRFANSQDKEPGSQTGESGGQTDYLDKGLNDAEKKYGGKYYDEEKVKGPNKKVSDRIKSKFHDLTGHDLPGSH
ncbi:hypothetical protein BJX61DRAFT_547056 [Aspergillus egyptiacus]|nr:hypothetical protein BJX61DRAFT_547056 [Aspergillus egyptiacus]